MSDVLPASGTPARMSPRAPLLATKLYTPSTRPNLVPRPRLRERLDQGLTSRLILVSGSAGFGKTTLLSQWLAECKCPAAWVSLDAGDNDLVRFLSYTIAALQTVAPGVGAGARGLFQSPQMPPLESILTVLVNELCSLPDDFVLIFDDYHLTDAAPIHDVVAFLIEHLPPQMHLVIASRADPPLPLARWRSRGQMVEIRTDDLRFTTTETTVFLNQIMGLSLAAEDVATLEARTEGWIVGLQMAALSLQGRQDAPHFIRTFSGSHRYVLDYLVEEVLHRQPEGVQTFLLQTSILEQLTGPLCDAVTGQDGGQAMLEKLEKENLFLIALDDERRWYRYHHLFADLLDARLRQSQPGLVATLHTRAAEWCEHSGLVGAAVSHALAARDFERAARLVEQSALDMLSRGEMTTLLSWIHTLPEELVLSRPRLCMIHAWVLAFTARLDETEPLLRAVEQRVRKSGPTAETQELLGEVSMIRSAAANMRGETTRAIQLGHMALELLPEGSLTARGVAVSTLGFAYSAEGDLERADEAFAELARIGETIGFRTVVQAKCQLAGLRKIQGRLHQAAGLYREALQVWAERGGQQLGTSGMVAVGMSDLLRERNDLEAARRYAMDGIEHMPWTEHMRWWESPHDLAFGYMTLARILQAQGDLDGAADAIQQAEKLKGRYDVYPEICDQIEACRVRLWLDRGDLAAALNWVQEMQISADDALHPAREVTHITLARVLIGQGRCNPASRPLQEAVRLLTTLAAATEAGGRHGRLIETLVLQALALQAQNDTAQALAILERCLVLAEPEGYVRVFVDEGASMATLLESGLRCRAWTDPQLVEYVSALLAAFGTRTKDVRPTRKGELLALVVDQSPLVEPLSERELEVLRLMADGLSNPEIAEELIIALGTVKTHTHNIYGKLGVQGRVQAIARARELNLL